MSTTEDYERVKSKLFSNLDWSDMKLSKYDEGDEIKIIAFRPIQTKIGKSHILLTEDDELIVGNKKVNAKCCEFQCVNKIFYSDGAVLFSIEFGEEKYYKGYKYNDLTIL